MKTALTTHLTKLAEANLDIMHDDFDFWACCLPEIFEEHYDKTFQKHCRVALESVAKSWHPNSVLEEMILHALLEEILEEHSDDHALVEEAEEALATVFEDTDFLMLYDLETATNWPQAAERLGLVNLDFQSWHKPFALR